ncbi:MAG TPA: PHP domain-containing protein [Ktedonobacterales bacterium]|nr:PHP domain-containing protein [Ktedonobacterales bacterium]
MSIISDFHSHVSRTSAREMVQAARDKGIKILGLSEHDFQMKEIRPLLLHLPREGVMMSLEEYVDAVRQAAEELDFDVRLGMEVDFIPSKNETIHTFIQEVSWDFLIGSVHEIDDEVYESDQITWSQEAGQARWLRYYELLRAAVSSGYFSLVSHPVRLYRTNQHIPPTLDEEMEHLAAEAARYNVALELNGYDILHYPELVKRLARACALHHAPISVGSDAHRPAEIAQAHAQTAAILQEVGISTVRIWKRREIEDYQLQDGGR